MVRFANDKLLPKDCLNILCVMKFRGSEVTTSGTSKPIRSGKVTLQIWITCHIHVPQLFMFSSWLLMQSSECIILAFSVADTLESEDGEEGSENKGLLDLLQTGDLADVDVVVGEKTFACHKAILGAKSPFFKAAFQHNMKEKATGKITISSDIESSIVYDMLVYIYGGTIEHIEDKSDKLLAAADEYCLKYLKRQCEENLCRTLTIDNCLDLLILADLHSTNILKPHVIKFVVENSREIVTQVWLYIGKIYCS